MSFEITLEKIINLFSPAADKIQAKSTPEATYDLYRYLDTAVEIGLKHKMTTEEALVLIIQNAASALQQNITNNRLHPSVQKHINRYYESNMS